MILWALAACLPHGASSHAEEQEATVYELRASAGAPAERLTRQYAREFPDGTVGWLVCLEVPRLCVELRSFPTGEVVQIRGLGAWPVEERARFAGFWPAFSPHLDDEQDLFTGWPMGTVGRRPARLVARGGWVKKADTWSWAADVGAQEVPGVSLAGTLTATVRVDRAGVREGTWRAELPWCAEGAGCVPWSGGGSFVRVGTQAPQAVAPCQQAAGPASRAPLCVEGGAPIEEPPGGFDLISFLGGDPAQANKSTMGAEAPP